jgi:xanthine dehydrogenase molybdopterin-binding subunit B
MYGVNVCCMRRDVEDKIIQDLWRVTACVCVQDGGELQASGEAVYADDVPILPGALHAAYVTSTQPHATLLEVDWSQALTVPGG